MNPGSPAASSWGLWGDDDTLGSLNLLTAERVVRASALIRRGAVFPLDSDLEVPNPPLFGRAPLNHKIIDKGGDFVDDVIDGYNTQNSSQWDGFRHVALDERLYNGLPHDCHGIDHWAKKGIVGRGVLIDVAGWRSARGTPLQLNQSDTVDPSELRAIIEKQGAIIEPGDIVLIHFGWHDWYRGLSTEVRDKLATLRAPRCPGLLAGREMVEMLWDLHIAAIVSDTPTVEVAPFSAGLDDDQRSSPYATLHHNLLPLLGMPMGELWDLSALARDCNDDGVYEFFVSSAPLHIRGAVGSPPNALAIK
jgi:kynurenine formamidase